MNKEGPWNDDEECRIISEKPLVVIVNPKYGHGYFEPCTICGKMPPIIQYQCPACGY